MTYRFIDEHKDQWSVRSLCETLEVSPASYYAWRHCPRSVGEQPRDALLVDIRAVHAEFKARYGSPRSHAELDTNSYPTGLKVSDEELAAVRITHDAFHGEWNYTIAPH